MPSVYWEEAAAEVNVEINLGPPVIVVDEPPEVVLCLQYGDLFSYPTRSWKIFF